MKEFVKRLNPQQRLVAAVAVLALIGNVVVEFKYGAFHGGANTVAYLYFVFIGWYFAKAKFEQDVHDALADATVVI